MSTIAFLSRPPGYVARQGYVKPLWEVVFRRSDNWWRYVPDDEAYNLPALKEKLESDKYSISTIDHVTVELTRTGELVRFLKGLSNPKRLRIKIFTYHIFRKGQKQLVWFGQLQNLPEGVDAYPWDKLKLTFMSPPGAWEDGDAVKDPATKSAYRNKHVTDLLLPKFLEKARWQAKGGTREWQLEEPAVRGENYSWSGIDRPRKRLVTENRKYDDTYKVKALCWDSYRNRLYLGVRGHPNDKDNDYSPWLMSYEPATRRWRKVTRFYYGGGDLSKNTGWEVLHLEYDPGSDKVYYVCQTKQQNLANKQAHYKCYGEIDMTNVPRPVVLDNSKLFTLHNKGFVLISRAVSYTNKSVTVGETTYYAYACAECIGFGQTRGAKVLGVLMLMGRIEPTLIKGIAKGNPTFKIERHSEKGQHPGVNDLVNVYKIGASHWESLGRIVEVEDLVDEGAFRITVQKKPKDTYYPDDKIYIFPYRNAPAANVFIAKPQNVKLEFHYPKGFTSTPAVPVCVEARKTEIGRDQRYWPYDLGEIDETGEFYADRVGYTSFMAFPDMEEYVPAEPAENSKYYIGGPAARFQITLEGYHPSFLIADGFRVESELQDHGKSRYCTWQPGKCRLTFYKDGEWLPCKVRHYPLATYGDIFLYKDASGIWAAWNDHGRDEETGEYYARCRIAKWDKNKEIFVERFCDRGGERWHDKSECYITSFVRYKNECYGGRRYYEPNWVHTNFRFFYGSSPQGPEQPTGFDGSFVACVMLPGDRTDIFEVGDEIRLGSDVRVGEPQGKTYYISEIETFRKRLSKNNEFLAENWYVILGYKTPPNEFNGEVTLLRVLSVGRPTGGQTYDQRVKKEMLNRYISLKKGRDERHEVWRL